jgi:hypothetical protein
MTAKTESSLSLEIASGACAECGDTTCTLYNGACDDCLMALTGGNWAEELLAFQQGEGSA